jgi:hypothetical protein
MSLSFSAARLLDASKAVAVRRLYTVALFASQHAEGSLCVCMCVFARPCATDCECVRLCLHVCVRARVCVARLRGASAWMRVRPGMCARPACVLVYVCGFACVRIRVRTRGCAAEACTTQGYSWDAPLVLAGYQRYSDGALDGALKIQSRGTQGVLMLMIGCTLGCVGGTPRKCVRACDTVHLLGSYDT